MNDCPNVEFRDRLPELVHERLDVVERAAVMAHVEGCDDCRAELELLRGMRAVLAVAPRVDIGRIVLALPVPSPRLTTKPRRRLREWQLAAAGVVLFVGGVSLATYAHVGMKARATDSSRVEPAKTGTGKTSDSVAPESVAIRGNELAIGGELSDLTPTELSNLLSDIEHLEPLPQTEPDVGTVSTEAPGDSS
jgi:anti-sigma factor RsiW